MTELILALFETSLLDPFVFILNITSINHAPRRIIIFEIFFLSVRSIISLIKTGKNIYDLKFLKRVFSPPSFFYLERRNIDSQRGGGGGR